MQFNKTGLFAALATTLLIIAIFEVPKWVDTLPGHKTVATEAEMVKETEHAAADKSDESVTDKITNLKKLIAKNPGNYIAQHKLAMLDLSEGRTGTKTIDPIEGYPAGTRLIDYANNYDPESLQNAEAAALQAVKTKPDYGDGYAMLGDIYLQEAKYPAAHDALQKAESLGSKDPWLQLFWADYLVRTNDMKGVITRATNAIDDAPDNKYLSWRAYEYLILAALADNQKARIVDYYHKELELYPKSTSIRERFARFLIISGDYDQAIDVARDEVKNNPKATGDYILALALYAKWADLAIKKKQGGPDTDKYLAEAHTLQCNPNDIMALEAVHPEQATLVKGLMSRGVSVDASDRDGATALITAANSGRTEAVRLLLDLGANPNARARNGWTPLFGATDNGYLDIVKLLVARGADPRQVYQKVDITTWANNHGHPEIAHYLQDYNKTNKYAEPPPAAFDNNTVMGP